MPQYTIDVENAHCDSCKATIERALRKLDTSDDKSMEVDVSIPEKRVIVKLAKEISPSAIAKTLFKHGFEVLSVNSRDQRSNQRGWLERWRTWRRNQAHDKVCSECQQGKEEEKGDVSVKYDLDEHEYRAVYSVGGMSCVACSSSIESALEEYGLKCDLLNKSASVVVSDKRKAGEIQEKVRELGYECDLVELLPVIRNEAWKVTASIGGMTCSACSATINEIVSAQPYVQSVNVSAITHSGVFVISDKSKAPDLKTIIEDAGYEYNEVELTEIYKANVALKSRTVNLAVDGMFCEHCPGRINEILTAYGDAVVVNDPISLAHPYIKFTYVPQVPSLTIRAILDKIKSTSPKFETRIVHPLTIEERSAMLVKQEQRSLALRLVLTLVIAIPTFIIGILGMQLLPKDNSTRMYLMEPMWVGSVNRATWALFFMATPVYLFADDVFHRKAIHELVGLWKSGVPWRRRFFKFGSMNMLMSMGTSIAYFASIALLALEARKRNLQGYTTTYFDSVVFLTLFLLLGRLLDSYSKAKTASAVSLLSLKPQHVQLIDEVDLDAESRFGDSRTIDFDHLEVGDFVRIPPGMSCPADGIVFENASAFDESALTGESMPVVHAVGDQVFAGTVNVGNASVVVKVTATEGLLDEIIQVIRQGQSNRAPIERLAERLTGVFVPIVTVLAVVTWLVWLISGVTGGLPQSYLDIDVGGWPVWSLQFAIAVFVVACPCGIGLAAPTALFVGTGLAANHGILARGGGEAFQEGARIDIVCFDKTGTLTKGGEPKVTDEFVFASGNLTREVLIGIARSMESHSAHPLATAVRSYSEESATVSDVSEMAGKGLVGSTSFGNVAIGNERLMLEFNADITDEIRDKMHLWKTQGKSVILLAVEEDGKFSVRLVLAAADEIRAESKRVVESLQRRGVQCWMITGDNEVTAQAVAAQVSIRPENVIAGVLPAEKSEKVQWLQKTGNHGKSSNSRAIVAMVGDGVNDAPSLSIADVGIAIGSGSDIALSSAKFVLLKSNLMAILVLLDISRKTLRRIKFNFAWALIYNCIGIPVAAGVIYPYHNSRLDPVWASLAMALSSVSVVTSSLLLKLYKPAEDIDY